MKPKKLIHDEAVARVPVLADRMSKINDQLNIAHYAKGSIVDYCHALNKSVIHIGKVPDDFTQEDVDNYLLDLLSRKLGPAESQFKHFIFGLKKYRTTMGCPGLLDLRLPKVRRRKKLPRILSVEQICHLLHSCELYSKCLYSVIYDCGLRASEACRLQWNDISYFLRLLSVYAIMECSPPQTERRSE